ncbi:hypothetical protein GGI20_005201 [Coemansia sp. BCRC 34301]|nr:hypothetical protein GGI20_005201 [Coemansia sp. BCRC 34301]
MVLVKEYRIINNCTVDEYRIAQLYAVAKMSMNETGGGEGVEVKQNEPYDNEKGKGQYTRKIYSFARQVISQVLQVRIPAWVRAVAPKGALELHEEAWNAYPHCLTVLTFPYLGNRFKVVTETMHLADRAETENALNLDADVLAVRTVESIDVANDKELSSGAYKESEDPKLYKATKTDRGPLTSEGWAQTCTPVMTCYKLLTVEFSYWGLQAMVEKFIHSTMRSVFAVFHRQLFCDTDGWFGMTIDELRAMEDETTKNLIDKRDQELTSKIDFS